LRRRPGFPRVYQTFPDEASAQAWASATLATVLSGGFLPLKPKARAPVRVVLAEYQSGVLPAQKGYKSICSRIKTLTRLLGDFNLSELTIEVLETFKRVRMGSTCRVAKGVAPAPRETRYRLKGRAKRLEKTAEAGTKRVSPQSCRHELTRLQHAVGRWSYTHRLMLETRGPPRNSTSSSRPRGPPGTFISLSPAAISVLREIGMKSEGSFSMCARIA